MTKTKTAITAENTEMTHKALSELHKLRNDIGLLSEHEANVRLLKRIAELIESGEIAGDAERIQRAAMAYGALVINATLVCDEIFEALPSFFELIATPIDLAS